MINLSLESKSALFVKDRLLRKYLTGIDIAEGFLLVCDKTVFFTDARYFYQAQKKLLDVGVDSLLYNGLEDVKRYIKEQKLKKLYIDFNRTTLSEFAEYKKLGVRICNGNELLVKARSIKTQSEIESIKKACQITEKAFYSVLSKIKVGITERQLKDLIESRMIEFGADGPSFDTIVAFGKNGAVPHHETGDTVLTDDTAILIDMGCTVNGYCSDLTRTFFYGTPSQSFLDAYNAVLMANLNAISQIKVGMRANEADALARNLLDERGYGDKFTHSLGHGVGLEIHEFPTLSKKRSDLLEEGMVFTVEPGVYVDGELGVRIEDTVALVNGKIERFFSDNKELIILKK